VIKNKITLPYRKETTS